jgi:type II secretory ATPase GspE/PulE/Tfp pilus assembly ATPase PilB-like protein
VLGILIYFVMSDFPSIKDLLKKSKGVSADDGGAPLIAPEEKKEKFSERMEEIRKESLEKEAQNKAASLGISYINLVAFPISADSLSLIPKAEAEKLKAICFLWSGDEVRVAAVNPEAAEIKELLYQIEEKTHAKGAIYLTSENSFLSALKLYKMIPEKREVVKGVKITEEELLKYQREIKDFKDLNDKIQKASVTDIVSMVIASAFGAEASDIHIEAEEKEIAIRFRLDGVLHDIAVLPKDLWKQIISRVKLLSGLKINITDKPQDGRFTIFLTNDKIDVRVSTIPTGFGESVVMRLLRSATVGLEFDDLGLRGDAYEELSRQIKRPNGMIMTTGPTGSGKTTTLYAILKKLSTPEVKIITLEDPIEYELEGINQSQVDISRGYTFAAGLRSILRQDPDVIMVGEIRDLETAETAIQAALTGHLVISTIHTNDAAGAIPRFLSMGVKPFLLSPALDAIIGQRLVRKICKECKEEAKLSDETLEKVKKLLNDLPEKIKKPVDLKKMKFYRGKGCPKCNGIGYKGRIGIYEILIMNKEIEQVILTSQVSEYTMRDIAKKNGMVTMAQDGLLKAIDGITSVEEVFSVAE